MKDYAARINDPSYVAPKELRNGVRHLSPSPQAQPVNKLDPEQMQQYVEQLKQASGSLVSVREQEAQTRHFPRFEPDRQGLAQELGYGWENNSPELSLDDERELDEAINDKQPSDRMQKILKLMTR